MSAAVCLLASLLSCPYPDTRARLQPTTEHTQSIKRERLAIERGRLDDAPMPIVARFGPDERFGTTDPQVQIPAIFSVVDENQEPDDPRTTIYKKRQKTKASLVDEPRQKVKTRTKIVLKTTGAKTVETAYVGHGRLRTSGDCPHFSVSATPPRPRYPNPSPVFPVSRWGNPDTKKSYVRLGYTKYR